MVQQFSDAGFRADLNDDQGATLNKKIRSAQLAQYNYIFGKDEYWGGNWGYLMCWSWNWSNFPATDVNITDYYVIVLVSSGGR